MEEMPNVVRVQTLVIIFVLCSLTLGFAPSRSSGDTRESAAENFQEGWRLIRRGKREQGMPLIEKAAKAGNADAQHVQGAVYLGLENFTQAARWYRAAAEQGHANAQFMLGSLYASGRGVEKDLEKSVGWLRLAVRQRHARAELILGAIYIVGDGIEKDETEGFRLIKNAAQKGEVEAEFRLGGLYEAGQGVTMDLAEAIRWYRSASSKGHAMAQNNLAWVLSTNTKPEFHKPREAYNFALVGNGQKDTSVTRDTLAATHAAMGRFQDAIREQKRAIEQAKKEGLDLLGFKKRLQQYEAGKPITCPSEHCFRP